MHCKWIGHTLRKPFLYITRQALDYDEPRNNRIGKLKEWGKLLSEGTCII